MVQGEEIEKAYGDEIEMVQGRRDAGITN